MLTTHQSQQHFLRVWKEQYLHPFETCIMGLQVRKKSNCDCGQQALWRCQDCCGCLEMCATCLRKTHLRLPWHRVQVWTSNSFYSDSWLHKVGVKLYGGHDGHPCPCLEVNSSSNETNDARGCEEALKDQNADVDDAGSWEDIEDETQSMHSSAMHRLMSSIGQLPPVAERNDAILRVVDISGIHDIAVQYCRCPNAVPKYIQLLELKLYPSSYNIPRTAFTFNLLDDFQNHNLVCKTSAHNYFTLLRRKTNNVFPAMIAVRFHIEYFDLMFILIQFFRTAIESSCVYHDSGAYLITGVVVALHTTAEIHPQATSTRCSARPAHSQM